jgi:hypothetical protein
VLATRYAALARRIGAVGALPLALNSSITAHVVAGELAAAAALVEELDAGNDATGNAVVPLGSMTRSIRSLIGAPSLHRRDPRSPNTHAGSSPWHPCESLAGALVRAVRTRTARDSADHDPAPNPEKHPFCPGQE